MNHRKFITAYSVPPIVLILGVGILCFIIAYIGRFSNDFRATEESQRFQLGASLGAFGWLGSMLLIICSLPYIAICLMRSKPEAALLTLIACVILLYGGGYAHYGYMELRGNPHRWIEQGRFIKDYKQQEAQQSDPIFTTKPNRVHTTD